MALLKLEKVKKYFPVRGGIWGRTQAWVHAVDDVDLSVEPGETVGLVGESGCGKSTLGRLIVRLLQADSGRIVFEGQDLTQVKGEVLRSLRPNLQMIFQDPFASLNPRMRIGDIIAEPLLIHRRIRPNEKHDAVVALLKRVGLQGEHYERFPHEFSGGQRQRIGIARALALNPKLIVADEAVSALDVSIAAQIVDLLRELQAEQGMAYVFISHDLPLVQSLSQRVAVMYLGKIVEWGPASALLHPLHPYTQALLAAVPIPDPRRRQDQPPLQGEVPSPLAPPSGCRFHTRCPLAEERCKQQVPELKEHAPGHWAACHLISK